MADKFETDPTVSDESAVRDPRGEDLASELLPEGEPYVIAADETDAEELTGEPGFTGATVVERPVEDGEEPFVDDPEQLAQAEAEVEAADNTIPVPSKRPKRKNVRDAVVADPTDEVAVADPADEVVATSSLRPKKRSTQVEKKDHATPKQRPHASQGETRHRVGPVQFVKESAAELRKVVWPTGSQLWQYFVVVLVFVLFIIAIVMGLDFLFGWLLLKFLG